MAEQVNCAVSDSSGCCRVVLWEGHVGRFEVGNCYRLVGVSVKCFNDVHYLSVSANSEVEGIDDIGQVVEEENTDIDRPVDLGDVVEEESTDNDRPVGSHVML